MLFGAIGSGLGRGSTNVQASGQFRRATSTCIFFAPRPSGEFREIGPGKVLPASHDPDDCCLASCYIQRVGS